jgi:hypothetical protein
VIGFARLFVNVIRAPNPCSWPSSLMNRTGTSALAMSATAAGPFCSAFSSVAARA